MVTIRLAHRTSQGDQPEQETQASSPNSVRARGRLLALVVATESGPSFSRINMKSTVELSQDSNLARAATEIAPTSKSPSPVAGPLRHPKSYLDQHVFHDLAVNIGQAVLPALEFESQTLVIDAELVQDCGLEIMHVDSVFDGVEPKVIACAV